MSWADVLSQLDVVMLLEVRYAHFTGSPACWSAGRGAKGAELAAWRLLSAGVLPPVGLCGC